MTALFVYKKGVRDSRVQIWPTLGKLSTATIQESREYIFELVGCDNPDASELYIDDQPIQALRNPSEDTARWLWSPGFYAGSIEMRLVLGPGRQIDETIVTDPDSHKLTRHDFDVMVREILQDTLALFSLSGFRVGIGRGLGDVTPSLARIEFLRSRLKEIESAVRQIESNPVRILTDAPKTVDCTKARNVSSRDLQRSFRSGPYISLPDGDMSRRFGGAFPARVRVTQRTSSLDISEHQAIKTSLQAWRSLLFRFASVIAGAKKLDDEELTRNRSVWVRRCRQLGRRVAQLLSLPLFREISDAPCHLVATPVFRNVVPYRRFFMLHREMSLGLARVQGEFLQMPLARTFELYELWTFLRFARAAAHRYELRDVDVSKVFAPGTDSGELSLAKAPCIQITEQAALAFKREFREYWLQEGWPESPQPGSFSRKMIPDMTLLAHKSGEYEQLIVFDAKYRIDAQLNDAIKSLHMYRDALVRASSHDSREHIVIGAYLVSPHLYSKGGAWASEKMPGPLLHPEYRSAFRFGAVSLRPGMSLDAVGDTLDEVLKDAGVQVVRGS